MFTDKELDELDRRFKMAAEDKFDAYNETINALRKDNERLRAANQIATQALFDICQSDWGIGHSMARPAHKAIKEMAALREDES